MRRTCALIRPSPASIRSSRTRASIGATTNRVSLRSKSASAWTNKHGDRSLAVPHDAQSDCPDPFTRQRIEHPLPLGVRCIDGLLTVGEGQRIGLFAGSGVGKSTLMGQIARNTAADLTVVALIGERGREVLEFVQDSLGEE